MVRAAAIGAALLLCSCGSDDPDSTDPPVPDGQPREQIAETVNAMFDAWNRADGELACAYMTARGQRLAVRIASQLHELREEIEPSDCVSAVEESAAVTEETIGQSVVPSAVSIQGERASVASAFRGALAMTQVDGVWLVDVPTFID